MDSVKLERLGIKVVSVRNPRILFVPGVGNVQIKIGEEIQDVFEAIYEFGFNQGKQKGKEEKSKQILEILTTNI